MLLIYSIISSTKDLCFRFRLLSMGEIENKSQLLSENLQYRNIGFINIGVQEEEEEIMKETS